MTLEPGLGSSALLRYSVIVGHLNLLTLVLDWGLVSDSAAPRSPRSGEPWMLGGALLAEAVRRHNRALLALLCRRSHDPVRPERSAAHPSQGGWAAFEVAVRQRDVAALELLRAHGGGPDGPDRAERLLSDHLRRAMNRRLLLAVVTPPRFLVAGDWAVRPGGRTEGVLAALIEAYPASPAIRADPRAGVAAVPADESFLRVADALLVPALTELGSVRLLQVAKTRGADVAGYDGGTVFFAILMGHWQVVKYMLSEDRRGVALAAWALQPRRISIIMLLAVLNAAVAGWFLYNSWGYFVAARCWVEMTRQPLMSGWCSWNLGSQLLDEDYWLRSTLLFVTLSATVWVSHKTMPLHGIVVGVALSVRHLWRHRRLERRRQQDGELDA
ncbi:hypothetical protein HK405_007127 [Cladochytrium tenue]|nr:hypothetical protein HK405_007127 [Cladochytrium tenue]